mmetsp:Transcript_13723/g.1231  ORF Transcript_13723/g.1231 Transcript_13723/m.1231 type:complete len:109 (-) Transcript_13723:128-454(-)
MPVSSSISLAATPIKLPSSSIIPAGHSNINYPAGTLYYLTNNILVLLAITNTPTDLPLKNTYPGSLFLECFKTVSTLKLTKPTLGPNINILNTVIELTSTSVTSKLLM